jgi:high frequency lysogenization protein
MRQKDIDRSLALAGIYQAAALVQQIAREGRVDEIPFQTSITSILRLDTASSEEIYGGIDGVRTGLMILRDQMSGNQDVEQLRYTVSLLHLERKLAKNKAMVATLGEGIRQAAQQAEYFSSTHDNVIARLADLYVQTISTLKPRIMVSGEQTYLSNPANTNRIRALLMAGIRSAVLWRQSGGSRLKMLFFRKRMFDTVEELLRRIEH